MHGVEMKGFGMQFRRLTVALKFPSKDRGVIFIITQCFPLRGLMFFAKMGAARFVPRERVGAHQLGKLEKISHPSSALERLIKILIVPRDGHFAPKCFS